MVSRLPFLRPVRRQRGRRRGRRLALLAVASAATAAYRNWALSANERRYAEQLGLGAAHPAEGARSPRAG